MANGRTELYATLVRAHAADLYRYAVRLTGCPDFAEDVVQETFQEAWRGLAGLRSPEAGRAWLFQILRNRHAHGVRAASRRPVPSSGVDELSHASSDAPDRSGLQRALDELDERFKTPFLMVFLEGLTCQETADALGIPLGTVLSRVHRARAALRVALEADAEVDARVLAIDDHPISGRRG
jgi:RNA polymerase sigma-70 factor (ECF subfamily)